MRIFLNVLMRSIASYNEKFRFYASIATLTAISNTSMKRASP